MTKISLDLSVLSDRDILNEVESRGLSSNNVGSNDEKIKRFKKFNDILRELVSAFYKEREIVHMKESFFEHIYDESGVRIGSMQHGFIT